MKPIKRLRLVYHMLMSWMLRERHSGFWGKHEIECAKLRANIYAPWWR